MTAASAMSVRPRCGAKTRSGGACGLPAGHGTAHVGVGRCRRHGGNTPAQVLRAEREQLLTDMAVFGGAIEVGPIELLLGAVYRAAGVCAWLRMKVETLPSALDGDRPHVWVVMEAEWLDRAARYAKMALDAGVAERQVRIAERTGARIAAALEEAVEPLGLAPAEQSATVARFVRALTVLEQTDDEDV